MPASLLGFQPSAWLSHRPLPLHGRSNAPDKQMAWTQMRGEDRVLVTGIWRFWVQAIKGFLGVKN